MNLRRALCLLLVAAGLAVSAPAAVAEPSPAPVVTAPAEPDVPVADTENEKKRERGVFGPFNDVNDADGVPITHYKLTGNAGSAWSPGDWPKRLLLFSMQGLFTLVQIIVGMLCWLLNWGFSFALADLLIGPARTVSHTYQDHVVDPLGLTGFFLLLAGLWCGLMILRGRTSRGVGELLVSLAISGVAATILLQPADLLLGENGLLGKTRDTSMSLSSIIATKGESDSSDPGQAAKPLTETLVTTFISKPHQLLNYGEVLDDPKGSGKCRTAYKKIVKDDLWERHSEEYGTVANSLFQKADCGELIAYNKNPTWDRLLGTAFLLGAVIIVAVLVLLMVGILLTAVAALAIYAMTGSIVSVVAVLPGGPRAVLWRWIGGVFKIVLVLVAVTIIIPLVALFLEAIMTATDGEPLVARFFLIDVVCLAALVYHRKLTAFGARAGYRIARRLEMARTGGARGAGSWGGEGGYGYGRLGTGWLGAGDPHGLSPVSLSGITRGSRAEIGRVTAPLGKVKQTWAGKPGDNARAIGKLGDDASALKKRMYASRGSRLLWKTGAGAATTGKAGLTYTVGLPITAPRIGKRANEAASAHSRALKEQLAASASNVHRYGQQWGRSTGLDQALQRGRLLADGLRFRMSSAETAGALASDRPRIVVTRQVSDSPVRGKVFAQPRLPVPPPPRSAVQDLARQLDERAQARAAAELRRRSAVEHFRNRLNERRLTR